MSNSQDTMGCKLRPQHTVLRNCVVATVIVAGVLIAVVALEPVIVRQLLCNQSTQADAIKYVITLKGIGAIPALLAACDCDARPSATPYELMREVDRACALRQSPLCVAVCKIVARAGGQAVPYLQAGLKYRDWRMRFVAACAIGELAGVDIRAWSANLRVQMMSDHVYVRHAIAHSLSGLGCDIGAVKQTQGSSVYIECPFAWRCRLLPEGVVQTMWLTTGG